ncbi:hypothetical protein V8E53_000828 [Lactarius tabidus]
MDGPRFLLEAPQLSQTHKERTPVIPRNNCRLKAIKCIQAKSQPRCKTCETGNSPCQSRDREHYIAGRSRILVARSSAGPSPAHSRRSSSPSIGPSAVSPAQGDSVDASDWYWGAQGSPDCRDPSLYASSSLLSSISSSPQSNPDLWFSSPLVASTKPHYQSGGQLSYTSSLLQLGNGSPRGYDTCCDIADTSRSQWNRMFNDVLSPFNSREVNIPHLTIPVHRQDGPQSPSYLANDPTTHFIAGSPPSLEVTSSSVKRVLGTLNANPDDAINEPIVNAVVSLHEDQRPPTQQVYASAQTPPLPDTHEYSTDFPHGLTQYDSESLAISLKTSSVSPPQQSPSPRPHTIASHLSLSSSSPSPSDIFAANSQQWGDMAIVESETSPEVPSSVETDPASTTVQQDQTSNTKVAEGPNFCHLCSVSFTQPQVFRRHLKDKHEDKESCTHCSSFKWSRGRPYLYRRHLKLKHPEVTSSEDLPQGFRKLKTTAGARQRNIPNRKTEATPDHLLHHRAS